MGETINWIVAANQLNTCSLGTSWHLALPHTSGLVLFPEHLQNFDRKKRFVCPVMIWFRWQKLPRIRSALLPCRVFRNAADGSGTLPKLRSTSGGKRTGLMMPHVHEFCVCVQCVCASGMPVAPGPMTYKFLVTSLYLKGSGNVLFFRFVFLVSFMFCPCSLLFAAFCSWNELEAAISTAFATLYEPLIFYGIATVWCYLQHFGAGSCHLSTIFAAFLSSNFLFSMVFATCWCSNCSCNMVVATRVDYVDYLELVLVLV